MTEVILEVSDKVINILYRSWSENATYGHRSSRDWYTYCDSIGLKKSPLGGWMVDSEPELTMLLLKINK